MRKHAFALLTAVFAFSFFGCSSVDQSQLIERTIPVAVSVTTDDAVATGTIPSDASRNFGGSILKQITSGLEDRGLICESNTVAQPRAAMLKVDLVGLQGESKFDVGPFGGSSKQIFKVNYSATLIAPDGRRLFRFSGAESSKVLAELPAEVGLYVAKRVARHYQAAK